MLMIAYHHADKQTNNVKNKNKYIKIMNSIRISAIFSEVYLLNKIY